MILKRVVLENIRSYVNQVIEFPEGSVLLSGDIGSGKSTILQAIEFALFGIKSEMPGTTLLRHGRNKGSVELEFLVGRQKVVIKRNLKRGRQGIGQESGYLIIDEVKKEATPTEIKSIVLELLGYPRGLVTKSKDLIFRFTVYTPQEEMKQILMEGRELRLDILRRVFNIDKYKRIRENSAFIAKEIKGRIKEFDGIIGDLEEKKAERKEKEADIQKIKASLNEILPELSIKKEKLGQKKKEISEIEGKIKSLQIYKNEIVKFDSELKSKIETIDNNSKNIEKLSMEISDLEKDETIKEEINMGEIKNKISKKERELNSIEGEVKKITLQLNEYKIASKNAEKIKTGILELNFCPVCRQQVTETHKHEIISKENKKINDSKKHIIELEHKEKQGNAGIERIKKELEILKKQERNFELIKLKQNNLQERRERMKNLTEEQKKLKQEIGKINTEKLELNKKIAALGEIDKNYDAIKKEYEKLLAEEKDLELKKVSCEKEIEGINRIVENLTQEIDKKMKIKNKAAEMKKLGEWISDFFMNLMSVIERHVMLRLYAEFNELFQNWFNMLIEDETLNVRLDEEFTPVIEQNGYETDIINLSGGERTALSLAYRLSLNKVINDFIETIQTKDIIILDEPTDGFSTEQLDKIRDVLDQLSITQTIIVSHEPKIEGFVENVIRIKKGEHVSSVV